MAAAAVPPNPADFLTSVLLPMLRNDMRTVVEAHCEVHGRPGSSASFTACLLCCITCEVMAELTAPPGCTKVADKRRDFYGRLGTLVGDHRYGLLGEVVHLGFRHGVAHTFLPKNTADVGCATVWLNGSRPEVSVCADSLSADTVQLRMQRAKHHLHLSGDQLTVAPQVFFLDVSAWLDDFQARLTQNDAGVAATLARTFPRWWNDTTSFRTKLEAPEAAVVSGATPVPPLWVTDYWTVRDAGGVEVRAWLERTQSGWRLRDDSVPAAGSHDFVSKEEADDHAEDQMRALVQHGFQPIG